MIQNWQTHDREEVVGMRRFGVGRAHVVLAILTVLIVVPRSAEWSW